MEARLMNMCMIEDKDDKVLVQERIKSWPGIAFPGGKVEKFEGIVESTIREIKEETGLDVSELKFCGLKTWIKDSDNIINIVFCFKTSNYKGDLIVESPEGKHYWVEKHALKNLNLADNFEATLELYFNENIIEILWKKVNDIWTTNIYK